MSRNRTRPLRRAATLVIMGLLGSMAAGCTDWAGHDLDYFWGTIPALSTMRGSVAYDPHELPRLPAEHTIPVTNPMGDVPPLFPQAQLDSAAATLSSPLAGAPAPEVLARGGLVYARQCAVCHGPEGAGDGSVVGPGKYPFAPAINVPATAGRSDGYLYAVVVAGRGLMPPYGERITHADRWAVVAYVRELQRRTGAVPASVPGVPTVVDPPDTLMGGVPAGDEAARPGDQQR